MEGVYHVDVVEVGGGGLVGEVHGVLEGQVPDREGLELGVTGLHAALVLVVELGEAGGHLAAAGAGRRDHDEAAGGLDVVVPAEALVGDDEGEVRGVVGYPVLEVDLDVEGLEALFELLGGLLAAAVGDGHAAHVEADGLEGVDEAEQVVVIGDAKVAAALAALYVVGGDDDDYLGLVLHLHEHAHLAVRLKARQHARVVVVVKELAAELQIQLAAELAHALADVLGLQGQILFVVKSDLHHNIPLFT